MINRFQITLTFILLFIATSAIGMGLNSPQSISTGGAAHIGVEEVNTNPNGISDVDPSHLFAKAVRDSFRSGLGYDYKIAGQMSHFYVGVFVERFIDQYLQDLSGDTYEDLFNTGYQNLLRYH